MTVDFAAMFVCGFLLLLVTLAAVMERHPDFWDRLAERIFPSHGE